MPRAQRSSANRQVQSGLDLDVIDHYICGAAFSGCSNLKELVDFRNTKVTYLGLGAFANCKMLDMDYNDFPSTIQTIEGSAFNNCAKLRSIDVSNLRSLGTYAFKDCTSLIAVYGFQNCSVKEIPEEAFYNSGLRGNVVMPSVEKVGKNAFYGCESITNLHLPKAAVLNAPILLIAKGKDTAVIDYISKNSAKDANVYVIGGEGAVSADIFSKLTAVRQNTERIADTNRYETSLKVFYVGQWWATKLKKPFGTDLIIADGNSFADALSASATGQPILLVNGKAGKELTEGQRALVKSLAKEKLGVVIAGGTGAVNAKLEADIAAVKKPTRLAGSDRYDTSVKIAEYFFKSPAALTIAFGGTFPDGLCGGPLGHKTNCPLILTAKSKEASANAYAKSKKTTTAWILGGTAVVSDDNISRIFK
ncbi:MAG: cell wall-binding repeat-containing protein [Ruminococcus sp.]|nr:cell wall-binding repeat-containing protein [Ruminococcus sp.]